MSINDPQWGNSHRPEEKEPEQVPEVTGTEPVQPKDASQETQPAKTPGQPVSPTPQRPPQSPPPEGPPDLEVLWQQLVYNTRCKIARALGKGAPPPPAATVPVPASEASAEATATGWQALSFKSWLIGVSLIFGAWLVSGFYLVDTPQRGVLSRFGGIVSVEDPGWHWRWPYPIDSVRLVNVTADRSLEVGLSSQSAQKGSRLRGLMPTADGNLLGVGYAVTYQVTDPVAYLSQADAPTDILVLLAESAVRDAVAGKTLPALLTGGNPVPAAATLQGARDRLQQTLAPFLIGITVKNLEIRDVQLPGAVTQSVKDAERQEQASAKALREIQAASIDNLIRARKLAAKLQDESAGYARAVDLSAQSVRNTPVAQDRAQAQKTLAEQAAAWRQQYPLVFASRADLQQYVQPTVAGTPAVGKIDTSAVTPAPTTDAWRDREIMRSRDRVDRPGGRS